MKRTYTSVVLAGLMSLGLAACSATGTTNAAGSSAAGSMNSGSGNVPMTESPENPAPKANGEVGISGSTDTRPGNISGNGTNTSTKTTDPNTSR